jgi:hypothetical protein
MACGNASATAQNILASERLFRLGVVSEPHLCGRIYLPALGSVPITRRGEQRGADFLSVLGQPQHQAMAAVHLVAAGVDVTVIRSWLGHAHLDTTNHYAQANLETKRKALEQVDPSLRSSKPPRWKRDLDLLAWLDSL